MNAQDRLLSVEEIGAMRSAIGVALTQDAKTLRALRPIVELAAGQECLGSLADPIPCGHCATCQARELLAEMDAQAKKEG